MPHWIDSEMPHWIYSEMPHWIDRETALLDKHRNRIENDEKRRNRIKIHMNCLIG